MEKFQVVYDENKKLDSLFISKYQKDLDMVRKNKIELLVEIGELANETKCFKYWTTKKPNSELVSLEYADCIIMCLCFCNYLNINLDNNFPIVSHNEDIISIFGNLYKLASAFYYDEQKKTIKEIFSLLIHLGHKLGYTDDDIINISLRKIKEDKERLQE